MNDYPIPANTEAEQGVLSCILMQTRSLGKVIDVLAPEHFCSDAHQLIYAALVSLYHQGKDCSLFNVSDELQRNHQLEAVGGESYLTDLKFGLLSLGKIDDYASSVKRTSAFRRLYDFSAKTADDALHQREGALERAEEALSRIALDLDIKQPATLDQALDRYMKTLSKRRENFEQGIPNSIPTGLGNLDRVLVGLKPSRLYVLAARPSVGKTSLALNIAFNVIRKLRGHVLFFSLEMDEEELMQRLLSSETPVDQTFLDSGSVKPPEMEQIKATRERMRGLQLQIEDQSYLLSTIVAETKQVHWAKKLDLIVIDYLQIMDVPRESRNEQRYQEVGKITKALKRLARDIKVPVLLLAQLGRKSEDHSAPQLSDLYESSRIEQDSDVVMLGHVESLEEARREKCEPYDVNIIVRKNRNGRVGTAKLRFRPRLTRFDDPAPEEYDDPRRD